MTIYADTSFLVPLYLWDQHTPRAQQKMALRPEIFFTPFHRAELIHAIHQHVFRKQISAMEAATVLSNIERDHRQAIWIVSNQPDGTCDVCARLAIKHVATLGVRMLDSLHVAAALELGASHFWTFDQRQARLAEAEGLITT